MICHHTQDKKKTKLNRNRVNYLARTATLTWKFVPYTDKRKSEVSPSSAVEDIVLK